MLPFFENKQEQMHVYPVENITFSPHLHVVMEVAYVTDGQLSVTLEGAAYLLNKGDVCFIFPNQVHSYGMDPIGLSGRGILALVPMSDVGKIQPLLRGKKPQSPALTGAQMPEETGNVFAELLTEYQNGEPYLPQAIFQLLFLRLMPLLQIREAPYSHAGALTGRAISYISNHYREPLTLENVAAQMDVTACHLSHVLSAAVKMNFRQYINALRVEYAKNLLLTGEDTILDVAMESGFDNLRTFNRAFQRVTHTTPNGFRTFGPAPYAGQGMGKG